MTLTSPFQSRRSFALSQPYDLLPVRFGRLRNDQYVVTNDVGEYVVVSRDDLVVTVPQQP